MADNKRSDIMNNRITEPRARLFEKQTKYGSAVKGADYSASYLCFNAELRLKPYLRRNKGVLKVQYALFLL